jgi:hypothetical protein
MEQLYFEAYGGCDPMPRSAMHACMCRCIIDALRGTTSINLMPVTDADMAVLSVHASRVIAMWRDFVAAYVSIYDGRLPYSWIVADNVAAVPGDQCNADFWEMFIDELMSSSSSSSKQRNANRKSGLKIKV